MLCVCMRVRTLWFYSFENDVRSNECAKKLKTSLINHYLIK